MSRNLQTSTHLLTEREVFSLKLSSLTNRYHVMKVEASRWKYPQNLRCHCNGHSFAWQKVLNTDLPSLSKRVWHAYGPEEIISHHFRRCRSEVLFHKMACHLDEAAIRHRRLTH